MIQEDGLWCKKSNLWVSIVEADEWHPPHPENTLLPFEEVLDRADKVSRQIITQDDLCFGDTLNDLDQALKNKEVEQIVGIFNQFLGRGIGLTPAGDDLILGLLLILNRWGPITCSSFPLEVLNSRVIHEAYAQTTTLGANLIECAVQGLADERLISGLDGLMTGALDGTACAACFNGWGKTSGFSAFMGIKLALSSGLVHWR